jgi:hypothetical protein
MKTTHSKLILSMLLSFAVLTFASGQKKAIEERSDRLAETADLITVKGTVTAFDKYCLKNAEITARRTRSKAITDSLGSFEILASRGDVLVFNANGFEKNRREVTANEDEISVNMILMPGEKNKQIAVYHGHMTEKYIENAVEHYNNINNDFPEYTNLRGLIQAKCLGARVMDQGGSIQVFIRGRDIGFTGLSENNGAAIFVLDGMIVRDIDFLNPRDVKYVTLLTGHEATRRYGSHGANGVVLINTK